MMQFLEANSIVGTLPPGRGFDVRKAAASSHLPMRVAQAVPVAVEAMPADRAAS